MIKVMFVCLGNICRSPMAEFILKDMVKKQNLENKFIINSSATSYEEIGNDMYRCAKEILDKKNIKHNKRKAVRLTFEDYNNYDFIIGMEKSNVENIKKITGKNDKIYKLLDFTNNPKDIIDPWYSRNFEMTYNEITEGCKGFLQYLKDKKLGSLSNSVGEQ